MHHREKNAFFVQTVKYGILTGCCILYAVAITMFLAPNSLAPGGVTGISIILNRITGVDTGTLIWLINIPIMVLGVRKFGLKFILSTIYCITLTSVLTNLLDSVGAVTKDPFLAAIAGSTLMAFSMGMIFKTGATTGGTDIIVKVLRLRIPHLKTGTLFLMIDAVIVTISAVIFRDVEKGIYAAITVYLTSTMLDTVLYGKDEAKLIYIISDRSQSITQRLLEELDIGVTHLQASGGYSKKEKSVIFCAVKKTIAPKTEEIVKQEDPQAFMIVSSATEIYGKGYKSYFVEKF